jgi:hypothetical protein
MIRIEPIELPLVPESSIQKGLCARRRRLPRQ